MEACIKIVLINKQKEWADVLPSTQLKLASLHRVQFNAARGRSHPQPPAGAEGFTVKALTQAEIDEVNCMHHHGGTAAGTALLTQKACLNAWWLMRGAKGTGMLSGWEKVGMMGR